MLRPLQVAILVSLGLISTGFARTLVRAQAAEENLFEQGYLEQMGPTEFLGTTALGGVRPLVIDLLWLRVSDSFRRKDWYEALPVADLICRLQPNVPTIWEFHSWNMSYNIAASKKQAGKSEEEWNWVLKGVEVQQDGVKKNPDAPDAHLWLSNILFSKGREPEFYDRFHEVGISPLDKAIEHARIAAELDHAGICRAACGHYRLAIFLAEKMARLEAGLDTDSSLGDIARETMRALETTKSRTHQHKDFADFRAKIDERLGQAEKYLESSKVSGQSQTKENEGG